MERRFIRTDLLSLYNADRPDTSPSTMSLPQGGPRDLTASPSDSLPPPLQQPPPLLCTHCLLFLLCNSCGPHWPFSVLPLTELKRVCLYFESVSVQSRRCDNVFSKTERSILNQQASQQCNVATSTVPSLIHCNSADIHCTVQR